MPRSFFFFPFSRPRADNRPPYLRIEARPASKATSPVPRTRIGLRFFVRNPLAATIGNRITIPLRPTSPASGIPGRRTARSTKAHNTKARNNKAPGPDRPAPQPDRARVARIAVNRRRRDHHRGRRDHNRCVCPVISMRVDRAVIMPRPMNVCERQRRRSQEDSHRRNTAKCQALHRTSP